DGAGTGCAGTYYTTDGSGPTTASTVYSSAISISSNATLKFFSVDNAGNSEVVKAETYTITPVNTGTGTGTTTDTGTGTGTTTDTGTGTGTTTDTGTGTGTGTATDTTDPKVTATAEGCFIATAAYGSYLDPHVKTLRDFRDGILLDSETGRVFVDIYYTYSPYFADMIEDSPVLRSAARLGLTPLVFGIEHPREAGFITLLIAMSFGYAGLRNERRRTVHDTSL
ncbi:MAG: chitobiase/beta-hexosaminidase C-terminal domain-containing protein, partial [Nitrospinota bacterium]|nr:chitobiase/beta-hexosaminidase C-terminal domain-containing protein [Nitrospinota bacterium]